MAEIQLLQAIETIDDYHKGDLVAKRVDQEANDVFKCLVRSGSPHSGR
jgi:hypothetical protein